MYCPNPECPDRARTGEPGEYRDGVTVCPYCSTPLEEAPGAAWSWAGPASEGDRPPGMDAEVVIVRTADLARISHRPAAAARDAPALAVFSRLRVLDGPPSPTARPSGRKRSHHRRLPRFASRDGEKCGLVRKQLAAAALDEAGIPYLERAVLPGGLALGHATWAPHPGQEYELVVTAAVEPTARKAVENAVGGVGEEDARLVPHGPSGGRRRGGIPVLLVLLVFGAMIALAIVRLLLHLL